MALTFQNAWQSALDVEKQLLNNLAEKEPTFANISHHISELRSACQNAILSDFEAARATDVEGRLWDAHLKINTRFRKLLSRFREDNGKKKKPVERRKLEKHYLEFIKSSQRFYRGFIQQLASQFGGVPELEKVARKFNFDTLSAAPTPQITEPVRKYVLQSCHATLIRLGDLSRYRETELATKERNWGPAIGYYDLATVIYPASGASHNQLAIIALADANHLRATYHLYRALSAQEPHPSARGNLEIEFRKVMNLWAKRELIGPEDAGIPGRALAPWFVYLHAQCYRGVDFPEHDELESEVLNQLAVDLKERSLEGTLQKFCLINIAAEDFSRVRSEEEPASNACLFLQRINVKTYFTLLQILLAEIERFAVEDANSNRDAKFGADKVTVVARRVLPALRNYSSWLLTVSQYLVAYNEKDTPLAVQLTEFWKIYANTLTLLASTFDVVNLPEVEYLLEEDEETLCFRPLSKGATSRRYLNVNGRQKPSINDPRIERNHPNIEMLCRIREFVIDGLDLVVSNKIPIELVDDEDKKTFIYKEDGLPSQLFASPSAHHHSLSAASIEREDINQVRQEAANHGTDAKSTLGGSQSASISMSANMHGIVEGVERLVESDTYENAPLMPNQLAASMGANPTPTQFLNQRQTPLSPPGLGPPMASYSAALDQLPSSYSHMPGLPNIWNTGTLSPGLRDVSSPRTPPGLGPQNQSPMTPRNFSSPGLQHAPQDTFRDDLMLRQSILAQSQLGNVSNGISLMSPMLAAPVSHQRLPSSSWGGNSAAVNESPYSQQAFPRSAGLGVSGLPMSSGLANASWPNNAFIAGSVTGFSSPGLDGTQKRPSAQYGAIGQSPRLEHGG
ncbi:uncharacterized protein BDV17DRAFT_281790 [Aspergillus undulatus]|uniref:uncharacterized protein n=1 Tax=Aspergillus undulatus TaxID=1810928 RepID=UPI003CCE165D